MCVGLQLWASPAPLLDKTSRAQQKWQKLISGCGMNIIARLHLVFTVVETLQENSAKEEKGSSDAHIPVV